MSADGEPLDLLSTSQTIPMICPFGAPFCALVVEGAGRICQTCCNHWECPVCGEVRARQEYRRIVHGCEVLALDHELYFWTLTCRGKEIPLKVAEEHYLEWTNRLLTNARTKAQRAEAYWCYVQVTERQKKTRAHPHSHIITTFLPDDAQQTTDERGNNAIVSAWFSRANSNSGLGSQHRITAVKSASAVSRYIAKYLFKDTMKQTFPPKWKRIRYSQNFPKMPIRAADLAIVLLSSAEWRAADNEAITWVADNLVIFEMARRRVARVVLNAT